MLLVGSPAMRIWETISCPKGYCIIVKILSTVSSLSSAQIYSMWYVCTTINIQIQIISKITAV